jgi:hypothetical protein
MVEIMEIPEDLCQRIKFLLTQKTALCIKLMNSRGSEFVRNPTFFPKNDALH